MRASERVPLVATVIGDDEEPIRPALHRAIVLGGGEVVGEAGTGRVLVPLVEHLRPRLVVLDLAVAGSAGLRIVPELLAAAPATTLAIFDPLVVLRSVDLLRVRVLDKSDLRQLRDLVRELASGVRLVEDPARTHHPPS